MSNTIKKKGGLGRGLSALLENAETDITSRETRPIGAISQIQLSQLEANPFQPRTEFDPAELDELAASIRVHGVIQPITVRKMGYDKYQLISGERRTRASILAGLERIPAYIRIANDQNMLEMALIENIQRSDLNAIDVAMSYKRLLDECSLKQEELGDRVGKDRTTVNNYLRLLKLPDDIQAGIKSGKISMGHARAMINMEDIAEQLELYHAIISDSLSVRSVEALVKDKKNGTRTAVFGTGGTDWDPEIDSITEQFHKLLKTAVHLKNNPSGKGKIIISYKNRSDLERILSMMKGS
ncbi:MAG: ParB/RepB/Spo0J family partition protein [Bacteroidetes bacterium]|nr:ParB/RepB/Spo0J family partition protein [Bacteroidota bacterium]